MWLGRLISLACTGIGGATIGYLYVWDQNGPDQNRAFNCLLPKSYYYFDKGRVKTSILPHRYLWTMSMTEKV